MTTWKELPPVENLDLISNGEFDGDYIPTLAESARTLRLQQLQEEFEAAQSVYAFEFNGNGQEYSDPDYVAGWPHEWWPDFKEKRDMVEAARHYIIARDFGEYNRERALTLWKLQRN